MWLVVVYNGLWLEIYSTMVDRRRSYSTGLRRGIVVLAVSRAHLIDKFITDIGELLVLLALPLTLPFKA